MPLIDTRAGLEETCRELRGASRFYLDTEFESSRDGTRLCLLQVSRGEQIHLIDTLRLTALEPLAELLGQSAAEWVLHAGQQDVPLLRGALRVAELPRVFDTQIAWALLSPEYSVSLAYLVYKLLGVRSQKTHQSDDWLRRPLPEAQLAYAASDIEHLPALREELGKRADALSRTNAILDASRETVSPEPSTPEPLGIQSFRNAWQLDAHGQAALKFLVGWYETLAPAERERAPEPKTLFSIASRLPESGEALARIKGVPRRWAAEYGERLVGQMMRATASADARGFVPIEPPPYATFEEVRLDGWLQLARAEISAGLAIAPELALPGRSLRKLRESLLSSPAAATSPGLFSGWREALIGPAFRAFAETNPPPARAG
jgi:ribonuclease D